jgi:prevent-host-death family protein
MKIIESNPKKVREIGLRQLRLNADEVVEAVRNGQSYLVRRKSEAVFRIVPVEEEVWQTVIDFTEVKPEGVEIKDILGAMEKVKRDNPDKYGR